MSARSQLVAFIGKPLRGLVQLRGPPPVGAVAPTGGYINGTPNGVLMGAGEGRVTRSALALAGHHALSASQFFKSHISCLTPQNGLSAPGVSLRMAKCRSPNREEPDFPARRLGRQSPVAGRPQRLFQFFQHRRLCFKHLFRADARVTDIFGDFQIDHNRHK